MSLAAAAQETSPNLSLVQANATLDQNLDAKALKQGDAVSARLSGKIHFANGTELPRGTTLLGHVDKVSQENGTSTVAWTFDKAQLKNGQTLPLKATLIGLYLSGNPESTTAVTLASDTVVDQQAGELPVALHSAVKDSDSGTLTSSHKNLKLTRGTELQFAVAAQPNAGASTTGN